MEEKNMNERTINLTAVPVEENIDDVKNIDLSKAVGNFIHQMTDDIGMDDKARELYHKGEASFTEEQVKQMEGWVMQSNMPGFIRLALKRYINEQK